MKILSVDIETTGLDPRTHGIIQMAAVAGDLKGGPGAAFYAWVQPENMVWSQYCLNLHYEWIARVNERVKKSDWRGTGVDNPPIARDYTELCDGFRAWAFAHGFYRKEMPSGKVQKPTAAGKCFGTFDVNFINHHLSGEFFRKRVFDPMHYYLYEDDELPPDLTACKNRAIVAGCKAFDTPEVAHRALNDAWDVLYLLQFAYSKGWIVHDKA